MPIEAWVEPEAIIEENEILGFEEAEVQRSKFTYTIDKNSNNIRVRVTPGTNTPDLVPAGDTYIVNISFTIRWLESYNIDLNPATITTSYDLVSTDRYTYTEDSITYHCRTFYNTEIYSAAAGWAANTPVTLLTITPDLTGFPGATGDFNLVKRDIYFIIPEEDPTLSLDVSPTITIYNFDNVTNIAYISDITGTASAVPLA